MQGPSLAYVNGKVVPIQQACISILDRGFLFADGVYEVAAVLEGRLVDLPAHLQRLDQSLKSIQLTCPLSFDELARQMQELAAQEGVREGLVYLQITRGAASSRDFGFPCPTDVASTLVMFAQSKPLIADPLAARGASVITVDDIRWRRRDIKSIALLPQVLGKQAALEAGAQEAWMLEEGFITEGTSSAAGIITRNDVVITRPRSREVLDSITRRALLAAGRHQALTFEERRFTLDEAYEAAEAFFASATALIMPVISINGRAIGSGEPGKWVPRFRATYLQQACSERPQLVDTPFV